MSEEYSIRNPLLRDGTSQDQRTPEALDPQFVKLDEREMDDFLVFAHRFSGLLNYYDTENTLSGTWKPFFEKDISINLALIAKSDIAGFKESYQSLLETVEANPTQANYAPLFDKIIELAVFIDSWYQKLDGTIGLRDKILAIIETDLRKALATLISYDKGATILSAGNPIGAVYRQLGSTWYAEGTNNYSIAAHFLAYGSGTTDSEKILTILSKVNAIFESFLKAASLIIKDAPTFLDKSVNDYSIHEPHIALYIAFIQLFRHAQDHLNEITERHLDYYFKEVLQLTEKEEVPDQAHIIIELAKSVDKYVMPKGTAFLGGKDATGANLVYTTDREVTFNKAEVDEVKTVFSQRGEVNNINGAVKTIYASPIANSTDGIGGEFDEGETRWYPLGESQLNKVDEERTMPDAELGFAIASPILLLNEGTRTITLTLQLEDYGVLLQYFTNNSETDNINELEIELRYNMRMLFSSHEGWIEGTIDTVEIDRSGTDTDDVIFTISIGEEAPAVTYYNQEVHEGTFDTRWPVLKAIMKPDGIAIAPFEISTNTNYSVLNGVITRISDSYSFPTMQEFVDSFGYPAYSSGTTYYKGNPGDPAIRISHRGTIYTPIKGSTSPPPVVNPNKDYYFTHVPLTINFGEYVIEPNLIPNNYFYEDFYWNQLPGNYSKEGILPYDENTTYSVGYKVTYKGKVFEAIKASVSPAPPNSEYWGYINGAETATSNPYQFVHIFWVRQITIDVSVAGVSNLILQNDSGRLDPNKSFHPFTSQPVVGSRFYIGHHEVFQKSISNLDISIDWEGLPGENFNTHYNSYGGDISGTDTLQVNNHSFQVDIDILDQGAWNSLSTSEKLFSGTSSQSPPPSHQDISGLSTSAARDTYLAPFDQLNQNSKKGFIRLELLSAVAGGAGNETPSSAFAFGHTEYPTLLASGLAATTEYVPNQPYTPTISSISLDYTSTETITFTETEEEDYNSRIEQLLLIHPFGWEEVHGYLLEENERIYVLPQWIGEGYLYMGVTNMDVPGTLSVFFKVAEGSGDPELEKPNLEWSVLSNNNWIVLEDINIISDTTNGLLTSGIIHFDISKYATTNNTVLPAGKHWLRACVTNNTQALSQIEEIKTQAVTVSYENNGNDPNHLATALSPKSIVKAVVKNPAVKAIQQPYPSINGKVQEEGVAFYTRISERLRHKNRAITIYDFERLVLDEFPDIYKVKCLNHTGILDNGLYCELEPGHVMVIAIPDLRGLESAETLEPKTSLNLLDEIRTYLARFCTPFITLKVKNPLYEQVKVTCEVGFIEGYDPGQYGLQLNEDLKDFLAPWSAGDYENIEFEGKVKSSIILNFIEDRPYVDYINNFKIDHIIDASNVESDVEVAEATTARSILVSAPVHNITPLELGDYGLRDEGYVAGVGVWRIGGDFWVY